MKDHVGQQFGNYRLLRFLGHGGFADVYLGEHIYLKNRAALKVLHTQVSDKGGQQFLIEAQTLAQFSHPHIVRVLDFGIEERTAFLVMDYLPRGTLRQRHPFGSCLSLEQITSYVEQIASAVLYLHESRRLIHRDIKPENLLLGATNQVQLADFGISLVVPSQQQLEGQAKAGTRPYMAPELFEGKPVFASDQYALGIMVYEWLCGTRPFHGNALALLYQQAVVSPPSLLAVDPSLPPEVEAVVFKALAKDPAQRYQSVQHFAQAFWQACQRNQTNHYLSAAPGAQNPHPVSGATPSRRIFVCHAQSDEALGKRLATDLRKQGMAVWLAQGAAPANGATPDGVSEEEVRRAVRCADAVLLVVSAETSSSTVVQQQLDLVGRYQRHVVGVLFPDTDLSSCLPQPWAPTIQVDQVEMRRRSYEQVLADVLTACARDWMEEEPEEEPVGEPRSPYKGLRPFTQTDAADFFGRERLVDALVKQVYQMTLPAQRGDSALPNETAVPENTAGGAPVFDQIALNSSHSREQQKRATVSDSKPCSAPEPHAVLPTASNRLLAVLGPSGSGKSSVVLAGLLPRLSQDGGAEKGRWIILSPMLPGDHPLEALALTLASHLPTDRRAHLRDALTNKATTGLHQLAQQITHQPEQKVVLFIDQLEEIFAPTVSEQERQQFFDLIVTAVTQPRGSMIVLLALRVDFYHRCISYPTLHRLMEQQHQTVYPMEADDLRVVIRGPAALPDVQLAFEGNLVGALLFEVQDQPGALPLLQFTLEQLFLHRQGHLLTLQAYREIGGVRGALVQHLEQVYMTLPSEGHRDLTRTLFLRLIEPGIGEQDITRRRASLTEFTLPDPSRTHLLREVRDAFLHAHLLTTNEIAGITTVEVSHEAVIDAWLRLDEWICAARQDLQRQQRVSRDAADWKRSGKPRTRLYRGSDLKEAQNWANRNLPSKQEAAFLSASHASRIQSLVSVVFLLAFLLTTTGLASWFFLTRPPDPRQVTTLDDDGVGSLRWALANVSQGSTITFDGNLKGTIFLKSNDLEIAKNVSIQGPDTDLVSVSSGHQNLKVHIFPTSSVTISHLTFKDGMLTAYSMIYNEGSLTLIHCTVSGNTAHSPSALSEDPTLGNGGGIYNTGKLTLTGTSISHNEAKKLGGGIYNTGILLLNNKSAISGNKAIGQYDAGGGIIGYAGQGGGIYNVGVLILNSSTISGNIAGDAGGGIDNGCGPDPLLDVFDCKKAKVIGTLTITHSTISNNVSEFGGGIENSSKFTMDSSMISGNRATVGEGGGIDNASPFSVLFTDSTITGNTSENNGKEMFGGGGISNETNGGEEGILTLKNCEVTGNSALNGGGINSRNSQLNVINSTISENTTFPVNPTNKTLPHVGGGISNLDGLVFLVNSTISGNTAHDSGGGIFNQGGGIHIVFCTIIENTGTDGGGIETVDDPTTQTIYSHVVMSATILVRNKADTYPNSFGQLTSGGYNLIQDLPVVDISENNPKFSRPGTDISVSSQDVATIFPFSAPLQGNGGSTKTYALLADKSNPAIDRIPLVDCNLHITFSSELVAIITTDQRGKPRPDGKEVMCDIGAYEVQD